MMACDKPELQKVVEKNELIKNNYNRSNSTRRERHKYKVL